MSWTTEQAKHFGLEVISGRYAFIPNTEWRFNNQVVLIDLKHQRLAADSNVRIVEDEIAAASPKFSTLQECLVYLKLRA